MDIRSLLEASGLTQTAFASLYHIPLRTLQGWLSGSRKPPEYVVWMISELEKSRP